MHFTMYRQRKERLIGTFMQIRYIGMKKVGNVFESLPYKSFLCTITQIFIKDNTVKIRSKV